MNHENADTEKRAIEFLLRFTRAAHEAGGYPAYELEPRIEGLSHTLGMGHVQVSATPTMVTLTVGVIPHQQVYMLRVEPHPINLHAIGRLDEMSSALADGRIDRARALEEIEDLGKNPIRRPAWIVLGAYGIVGGAIVPIIGGGWHEAVAAALIGMPVGMMTRSITRRNRFASLAAPLGAFLASFLAAAIADAGFYISVREVTFAGIIALVPGLALAIGIRELATGHVQAGLANAANAVVQLIGLAFGVAAGASVAESWIGSTPINPPDPSPRGWDIAASAVVGLGFVVTLRAPARDTVWTCSGAVLALVVSLFATDFIGRIAGTLVAAFIVGLAGNAIAHRFRRSPITFIVPGLLLLIPGSFGYQGASSLLAGRTLTGIDLAFDTFVIMLAISYGLVASTLILPDRHTQPCRRKPGAGSLNRSHGREEHRSLRGRDGQYIRQQRVEYHPA